MEGIQNYLRKFELIKNPKAEKEKLVEIIFKETKVKIETKQVIDKKNFFLLNLSPTTKSVIFLKKKIIEKRFGKKIT